MVRHMLLRAEPTAHFSLPCCDTCWSVHPTCAQTQAGAFSV